MLNYAQLVICFSLYSVVGWICETIYCSVPQRQFVSRGFLHGPYCPIYGFGALLILLVTQPYAQHPALVFLAAMVAASVLEYFTGWLMETIFQIRWWDYSQRKFNLKGRVCLKNSLLFGVMGVGVTCLVHPFVQRLMGRIPSNTQRLLASGILFLLALDLLLTLNTLLRLTDRLKNLQLQLEELDRYHQQHAWFDRRDLAGSLERLGQICQQDQDNQVAQEILARLQSLAGKRDRSFRLLKAYPGMKHKRLVGTAEALGQLWQQGKQTLRGQLRNHMQRLGRSTVATTQKAAKALVQQPTLYHMVWVFAVAGVLGFVVETLFCLVATGTLQNRQGTIYGPFNQVYGFGAVLMVMVLTPLAKKNDRWLFLGGAVVGGTFEFFCSWLQEKLFGTVSWEYSHHQFSIGGRTNLTYMFFWGILALWFMKGVYPWLLRLIDRIPRRQGVFFAWVLAIGLSANMLLSGAAVARWTQREQGVPATGAVQQFFDQNYPNQVMEEVYPSMQAAVEGARPAAVDNALQP